jgi:hypothetical protein
MAKLDEVDVERGIEYWGFWYCWGWAWDTDRLVLTARGGVGGDDDLGVRGIPIPSSDSSDEEDPDRSRGGAT